MVGIAYPGQLPAGHASWVCPTTKATIHVPSCRTRPEDLKHNSRQHISLNLWGEEREYELRGRRRGPICGRRLDRHHDGLTIQVLRRQPRKAKSSCTCPTRHRGRCSSGWQRRVRRLSASLTSRPIWRRPVSSAARQMGREGAGDAECYVDRRCPDRERGRARGIDWFLSGEIGWVGSSVV